MSVYDPLSSLPPESRELFARIGPVWGGDIRRYRDLVDEAYLPILAAADKSGVEVFRDVPYGDHERQTVDIFMPAGRTASDVMLYVHGGAFIHGAKRRNAEIFDNVLYWFARQGFVGVSVEYRLASQAPYPGGAEDVGSAVAWTKANIAGYGGHPQRIFIIGHSAGAAHVVGFAFDPGVTAKPGPEVAGIVSISGRLRADVLPDNPTADGVRAYFGADEGLYEERSPLMHAHRSSIPIFIAIAEFENPYLDVYGAEFFHRLAASRRHAPRFVRMREHNHISIVTHFNSGEDFIGHEICDFARRGK